MIRLWAEKGILASGNCDRGLPVVDQSIERSRYFLYYSDT